MAFDDSFALSDAVAFAEMGAPVTINGSEIVAIRQPGEVSNNAADGGLAPDLSVRFDISALDYANFSVRVGSKVQQEAEKWRVASVRHRAGTVELVCVSTSGQTGREF